MHTESDIVDFLKEHRDVFVKRFVPDSYYRYRVAELNQTTEEQATLTYLDRCAEVIIEEVTRNLSVTTEQVITVIEAMDFKEYVNDQSRHRWRYLKRTS